MKGSQNSQNKGQDSSLALRMAYKRVFQRPVGVSKYLQLGDLNATDVEECKAYVFQQG